MIFNYVPWIIMFTLGHVISLSYGALGGSAKKTTLSETDEFLEELESTTSFKKSTISETKEFLEEFASTASAKKNTTSEADYEILEELKDIVSESTTRNTTTKNTTTEREMIFLEYDGDPSDGTHPGKTGGKNESVKPAGKGNHGGMDGNRDSNRDSNRGHGKVNEKMKIESSHTDNELIPGPNPDAEWLSNATKILSLLQMSINRSDEHYERLRNFIIAAIISQVILAIIVVAIFLIALHWKFQQLYMSIEIVPEILAPLNT